MIYIQEWLLSWYIDSYDGRIDLIFQGGPDRCHGHHWSHQHHRYFVTQSAFKFQNKQFVYEASYYKLFFHPYMQAMTIFLAEALVYIVFEIRKRRDL